MPPRISTKDARRIPMTISPDMDSIKYKYPNKLDLKPDSELHKKLVDYVLQRAYRAHEVVQKRHSTWAKIEKDLTVYIEKDDYEKAVQNKDDRKPVSLVVPTSYATLETLLTFLTGNFLAESPYFRYQGSGPEDTLGAILLEMAVAYQSVKADHPLALHTQWRDALVYGYGVLAPQWTTHRGRRVKMVDRMEGTVFEGVFPKVRKNVDAVLFEGHKLCNINPYRYFPDPTVPVHRPNDGEYVGWIDRTNLMGLLRGESDGDYFNVKYLKEWLKDSAGVSYLYEDTESSDRHGPERDPYDEHESRPVDVIYMYVDLIPAEWGIGKKEEPEKWMFAVAADSVLLQAKPIDLNHNMFPVSVCAPDTDGYAGLPLAKLEVINGLQHTLNWLISSHITNIRKSINNQWIVDPSMVVMQDLQDPEPGKLVRLRKKAWQRGVDLNSVIMQLPVTDITQNHIADMAQMQGLMERAVVSDQLTGLLPNRGERISADESRGARLAGLSRLEHMAMMIAFQSMHKLGDMLASQTQQFMSVEAYQKATGRWKEELIEELGEENFDPNVVIGIEDILVNYDIKPAEPASRNGEFVQDWVQVLQIVGSSEQLTQQFDVARILKHIARLTGAKNLSDFERQQINTQVMSPEQIAGMQDQLVPIGGTNAA